MGDLAKIIFQHDILADKANPSAGKNGFEQIYFSKRRSGYIRVPMSYLFKFSLAEIVDPQRKVHPLIHQTGLNIMQYYLNDNTSPETSSFYIISLQSEKGMGRSVAKEMSMRFLLSQLLVMYANEKYTLRSRTKSDDFFLPAPADATENFK